MLANIPSVGKDAFSNRLIVRAHHYQLVPKEILFTNYCNGMTKTIYDPHFYLSTSPTETRLEMLGIEGRRKEGGAGRMRIHLPSIHI
jgi:hypothetical protein